MSLSTNTERGIAINVLFNISKSFILYKIIK